MNVRTATGALLGQAIQINYMRRNTNASGISSAFFITWDGAIVRSTGTVAAPNGSYQLQFSNLKALGNPLNPADAETFTLPVITISR